MGEAYLRYGGNELSGDQEVQFSVFAMGYLRCCFMCHESRDIEEVSCE